MAETKIAESQKGGQGTQDAKPAPLKGRPPTARERLRERYPDPDQFFQLVIEKGPKQMGEEVGVSSDAVRRYGLQLSKERYEQAIRQRRIKKGVEIAKEHLPYPQPQPPESSSQP